MTIDETQTKIAGAPVAARQLVLAGPGTGKTETVALRLSCLLRDGVRPTQIQVLSFSRSAVRTLMHRLEKFTDEYEQSLDELRHISVRTFDSWTFRMLRRLGYTPGKLLGGSHDMNIALLTQLMSGARRHEVNGLLEDVRHVIVDEFQDLSGVRAGLVLSLLDLLAPADSEGAGFTMLGDEAQAIYGFALRDQQHSPEGDLSAAGLVRAVRERYRKELVTTALTTNYRSVDNLASLAVNLRSILTRTTSGQTKLDAMRKLLLAVPEGRIELSPAPNGEGQHETAAILTRTNGEAIRVYQKILGDDCRPTGVSVSLDAASRPNQVPAWIGAALGRFQGTTLTRGQFHKIYDHVYPSVEPGAARGMEVPEEDAAWALLLRAGGAGPGAASISLPELRRRIEWPDAFPDDESLPEGTVHISTIHQSKGREFERVSLVQPRNEMRSPDSEQAALEEASVIFVGVTRAGRIISRIPSGDLYPLSLWTFDHGTRKRWGWWKRGWINMEMGISGDIRGTSFIDTRVHGSEENIGDLQEFLMQHADELRLRKVMLKKTQVPDEPGHFVYGIHLQEENRPGALLGLTSQRLTFDILHRLGGKYSLPTTILNLRITSVVTLALQGDDVSGLARPWSSSGLWLGVSIYGTGDFKSYRRQRG